MPRVTFYTKPNCPLCDDALEQIELARRDREFELESVNILEREEAYFRYRYDIPVVCIDGVDAFRHRLTAAELLERLRGTQTDEDH